jgi:hypothetical protein
VLALLRLHATGGYCSPRHALILSLLLIAAAGAGIERSIAAAVDFAARHAPRSARAVGPIARLLMLGGLAGFLGPRTLAPVNEGLGGYRAAGHWIEAHVPADAWVVDVTGWALYYGRHRGFTFENLVQASTEPGIRWIVAREAHMKGPWPYCRQLRDLVGDAPPVAVFRGANPRHPTKVFIYDRRWADAKATPTPTIAAPAAAIRR